MFIKKVCPDVQSFMIQKTRERWIRVYTPRVFWRQKLHYDVTDVSKWRRSVYTAVQPSPLTVFRDKERLNLFIFFQVFDNVFFI